MLAAFVHFEGSYSLPFSTILDMVQCWPIKEWHQNMSREFRSFHPTTNKKTKCVQINKADNYLSKSEIRSISIFFIVPQLSSDQKAKIYWGHVWNELWPDLTYVAFHPSSDVSLSVLNLTTIDPLVATGWGAVRPQNLPLLVPFTDPSNIETESYWQLLPAAKKNASFDLLCVKSLIDFLWNLRFHSG